MNNKLCSLNLPEDIIEGLRRTDWDEGYEPATRFAVFLHFTHGLGVGNVPSIVAPGDDVDLRSALADSWCR